MDNKENPEDVLNRWLESIFNEKRLVVIQGHSSDGGDSAKQVLGHRLHRDQYRQEAVRWMKEQNIPLNDGFLPMSLVARMDAAELRGFMNANASDGTRFADSFRMSFLDKSLCDSWEEAPHITTVPEPSYKEPSQLVKLALKDLGRVGFECLPWQKPLKPSTDQYESGFIYVSGDIEVTKEQYWAIKLWFESHELEGLQVDRISSEHIYIFTVPKGRDLVKDPMKLDSSSQEPHHVTEYREDDLIQKISITLAPKSFEKMQALYGNKNWFRVVPQIDLSDGFYRD